METKTLITKDKLKIVYQIKRRQEPFLVFVHGLGGDLNAYYLVEKYLPQNYSILSYDQRGHGLSTAPFGKKYYYLANFVADLYELIKREKIEQFYLIGQCFGGMICQLFAKQHQAKIKGLILLSTAPYFPWPILILALNPVLFLGLKIFSALPFLYYQKRKKPEIEVNYEKADFTLRRWLADFYHTSPGSWSQIYWQALTFSYKKYGGKSNNLVTKIIYGLRDTFYSPNMVLKLQDFFINSQLKAIDANHLIPLNQPKILAREIANFVNCGHQDKRE